MTLLHTLLLFCNLLFRLTKIFIYRFFQNLGEDDEEALDLLGDLFHFTQYSEGDVIFSESDLSDDGLYVIVHGSTEVRSIKSNGESVLLAVLDEGQPFGELSLLNDTRRTGKVYKYT